MNVFEQSAAFFIFVNLVILLVGFQQVKNKKSYTVTPFLFPLGIFVWLDAIAISVFWILSSFISLLFNDWYLFLLFISVFWLIRSIGEAHYWISEQFTPIKRNDPKHLFGLWIFKGEEIYVAYQVFWQCVSVLFGILSVYLTFLWLSNMLK